MHELLDRIDSGSYHRLAGGMDHRLAFLATRRQGSRGRGATASRAAGITYTNTTGKPIVVNLSCVCSSAQGFKLIINGISVGTAYNANPSAMIGSVSGVVPNWGTYSTTLEGGAPIMRHWSELR